MAIAIWTSPRGVAVNALGHAHPHLVAAVAEQSKKLWHVSNLYRVPEAERLADRLCSIFADLVFFCNSGAEAMECSIKVARKHHAASGHPERFRIITFEGAFHGRTLATLAAGGNKKYLDGFGPVAGGFDHIPFGDIEVVKRTHPGNGRDFDRADPGRRWRPGGSQFLLAKPARAL